MNSCVEVIESSCRKEMKTAICYNKIVLTLWKIIEKLHKFSIHLNIEICIYLKLRKRKDKLVNFQYLFNC